jgi:hypothetical protein
MCTKLEALKVLRMYKLTNDPGVLIEPGLRPYQPFWMDLPFAKLYTSIAPDLLHQIYTRIFKDHLLKWGTQLVGVTRMDAHFKSMPRAEGIRHFPEGISRVTMWTGAECREMQKVLLPILVDTVDEGIITAVRAIIDFSYLAHMAAMTDSDLEELISALQTFHRYKSALITAGIMSHKNFNDIPKLHMLSHYAFSICQLGMPDGYSTKCRKLHQDPQVNSNFPQFFPKPICAGFRSRDPGAYSCRVAALVRAKTPEFLLSLSYLY